MTNVPIRSIFISDFRRLEGHRVLPLDAPIVLMHGPNGSGKTSVLSALEIALTGDIRSMRRQDQRYTAHLPFQGQEFATLRVTVAQDFAVSADPITMTVGGSRIDGAPAFAPDAAQFFTERCYLDQVSLGRLLELYQFREGKEESALARFVNELLGLEQLDALRSGLYPATDFRRLKGLSELLADADSEAQRASSDLSQAARQLEVAREPLTQARRELTEAIVNLGLSVPQVSDEEFGLRVEELLRLSTPVPDNAIVELNRSVAALGGRVETLAQRPSVRRLEDARAARDESAAAFERWSQEYAEAIDAWRAAATELDLDVSDDEGGVLDDEAERIARRLANQEGLVERASELDEQLNQHREELAAIQVALSGAHEQVGSLVEGLAALREHAVNNVCPVCDRNFDEVSSTHLTVHIDRKIDDLVSQGVQIRELRHQRDESAAQVQGDEEALDAVRAQLWSESQRTAASSRAAALRDLREQLENLRPAIDLGREAERQREHAARELEELEAFAREVDIAITELEKLARALDAPAAPEGSTLEDQWRQLADVAADRVERHAVSQRAHARAVELLARHREYAGRLADLTTAIADRAEDKARWDERVREAKRRQNVAKAVLDASSAARTAIVQRVFTESLNEVWRGVFTRLAPREPFVPAFGIPSSARTILELELRTVHSSGETGGAPQVMLSAGNLNTAALSLFIALHLAVEPVVPCLVFDDPVQSMDEVHVAQLAGLIRVLAKHHNRQVIIAVHERELFQYLALELSPAFEGDELITIELGARSGDEDRGITRFTWNSDEAIAV